MGCDFRLQLAYFQGGIAAGQLLESAVILRGIGDGLSRGFLFTTIALGDITQYVIFAEFCG